MREDTIIFFLARLHDLSPRFLPTLFNTVDSTHVLDLDLEGNQQTQKRIGPHKGLRSMRVAGEADENEGPDQGRGRRRELTT